MDQIGKGFDREVMLSHRGKQCDIDRMLCLSGIHTIQFVSPPIEEPETLRLITDLIAEIVSPTAERVDVVEVLMQLFGKQKADDVEVLVVRGCQPSRILLGFCTSPGALKRFLRLDEMFWTKVWHP
jgi:hypothetical protein